LGVRRNQEVNKFVATALALAFALITLVPGLAAARLAGNHNQTELN
jgi:hypothetical protein